MHIFAVKTQSLSASAMFGKVINNLQGQKRDILKLYSVNPI